MGRLKITLKENDWEFLNNYFQILSYNANVNKIKEDGAEIVELTPPQVGLPGFITLLNIDMKHDLPEYLKNHTDKNVKVRSVKDVVDFNLKDSILRSPLWSTIV